MGIYRNFFILFIKAFTGFFIGVGAYCNATIAAIPGDSVIVSGILIEGNKVTRDEIIYRELTFSKGERIAFAHLSSILDSSTQNLMNTFLFNFVSLTPQFPDDSTQAIIVINVSERWYWWPAPILTLVDINFKDWLRDKDLAQTTYGLILTRKNFRGRNETVSLGIQQGFSERYSLSYRIPYINRRLKDGISISASFLQSKQALYSTLGSLPLYFKSLDYIRRDFNLSFLYSYRRGFYHTTGVYTSYRRTQIGDSLLAINKDFFLSGNSSQQYTTLGVYFVDDHRDFHAYPLRGHYFSIDVAKQGLNIINEDVDNLSVIGTFKIYKDLRSKFYWAGSARARLTNRAKQSFFNQVGIGSGNSGIQGFDNFLILGQNNYVVKSALKYNLLAERIIYLNFIPIEKFNRIPFAAFFNLFADAGYVEDKYFRTPGELTNQLLYGFGAGFDFVTYYNLILRVEYSFNKFGENGLFIHFSSPI
ncbi:MAG: POTRA domain-containing protein [Bacteroidia bacterium]